MDPGLRRDDEGRDGTQFGVLPNWGQKRSAPDRDGIPGT
jgi:hypothetical protein